MNEKKIEFKWYILNVISGQEKRICDFINSIAVNNTYIDSSFVPIRNDFKYVKGKKVMVQHKIFPAYVYVRLCFDSAGEIYSLIRGISGVLSFLGIQNKPTEVKQEEMDKIFEMVSNANSSSTNTYVVGETIKVISGPFESFVGVINSVDSAKNTLKVTISIFGRDTLVDIGFDQIEKYN